MPAVPNTRNAIIALLEAEGAMDAASISAALGIGREAIDSSIKLARKHNLLHIVDWKRNLSTGGRMGAIWAAGEGKDKPQPKFDARERHRRYAEKYREVLRRKTNAKRGRPMNPWLDILRAA